MRKYILVLMGMMMTSSAQAKETATAIFAGGCFWCMESEFQTKPGIISVTSGYTGGDASDANYEKVSAKKTSHVEAVEVVYDPAQVDYAALLQIYWSNIDPTDAGGQFYDRGPQYATVIYYADAQEKQLAEASKDAVAKKLGKPIVTRIEPRVAFFTAEQEHQDYFENNPIHYNAYVKGSGRKEKIKAIYGTHKEAD